MIRLPNAEGMIENYHLATAKSLIVEKGVALPRIAFSAVHVVADPLADIDPWLAPAIDWDSTIDYRRYIWGLGLGVAEALDTAQRGMGLGWQEAQDLIRYSLEAAEDFPDAIIAAGCGTDHLPPGPGVKIDDVIRAYEEQMEFVEGLGGRLIIMATVSCSSAEGKWLDVPELDI